MQRLKPMAPIQPICPIFLIFHEMSQIIRESRTNFKGTQAADAHAH